MRVFIALDLPREAISYIKEIQNLLRKKNLFVGKLTEGENLHLTLKFLGEIDEERIEEIRERLREIRFSVFDTELGEVGVFSKKFIRIIWIKLENCGKLQKKIDEKLSGMFEPEFRFMSHITLARVKNVKDKRALIDYLNNIKSRKIRFKVESFFLKKSELSSEGPVYEDIEEYNAEKK